MQNTFIKDYYLAFIFIFYQKWLILVKYFFMTKEKRYEKIVNSVRINTNIQTPFIIKTVNIVMDEERCTVIEAVKILLRKGCEVHKTGKDE